MITEDQLNKAADNLQSNIQQNKLQRSLYAGAQSQPDTEAKLQDLARRLNMPVDVVRAKQPEAELDARLQSFDVDKISKQSPKTAAWLSNPNNAAIAHDDVENMSTMERLIRGIGQRSSSIASGFYRAVGTSTAPIAQALEEYLPLGSLEITDNSIKWRKSIDEDFAGAGALRSTTAFYDDAATAANYQPGTSWEDVKQSPLKQFLPFALEQGIVSIPDMLAAVAMLPPYIAARSGELGQTRAENDQRQDATVSDLLTVMPFAVASATLEKIGAKGIVGLDEVALTSLKQVPKAVGKAAAKEGVTEAIQEGLDSTAETAYTKKGFDAAETADRMLAGAVVGAPFGGVVRGVQGTFEATINSHLKNSQKAQQAEAGAAALDQINELATASKLAQRNPESFQQFIAAAAENGPVENVYIDAKTLAQSGIAGELAKVSPAVAEQLDRALVGNSQIAIPVAEYAAKIAPTEYAQALRAHLRTDPEGFTLAEAETYMKEAAPQLQAEMTQVLESKNVDDNFKKSMQVVKQAVLDEMNQAGRFTPAKNEADATLVASYYAVRSQQLGITPEELFNRRRLRVGAEALPGRAYNAGDSDVKLLQQDPPSAAELLNPDNIPDSLREQDSGLSVDIGEDFDPAIFKDQAGGLPEPGSPDAQPTRMRTPPPDRMSKFYQGPAESSLPETIDINGTQRPTTNSKGQPIADTEEKIQAFYEWFGDSKVVDEDGKPLVVYHGTDADFSEFNKSLIKSKFPYSFGFHFTTRTEEASSYADKNTDSVVMPVYIKAVNALVIDTKQSTASMEADINRAEIIANLVESEKPYDGVIINRVRGDEWDGSNIIVFDPAQIKSAIGNRGTFDAGNPSILLQDTAPNRGSFNPETLQITLLKNADLSTFLHESGHFFFQNDIDLASELIKEVDDVTKLAPGEQKIVNDVSALLKWHGIQGTVQEQLAQWHNMDFEEKRSSHERTAESFEKYLIEGKAPSIELAPYFQTFRAWLLNVYKSLKDFLAGHPEAGQLNDEVRGIFDRMLATDDQIALAEQGRSMMPLFTSAEKAGWTPERFAEYQATGKEATATAVQELDSKGLRDMQWSHNKYGKELKKLQKEHAEKRREVRAVVRVEVMSQPVYRAWQFLTNRFGQDDKPSKPVKTDSSQVDEKTDSLFTAIAKLGGLNRAMVEAEFGLDPAEKSPMPIFGKYVLRAGDAGLSPNAMAEKLSDYGYLELDQHGKWEISGLEDRVMAELRGDPQYSVGYDYANAQEKRAGDKVINPSSLGAGRLDRASLADMDLTVDILGKIDKLKMVKKDALHPDIVAYLTGFNSGDEMVRALAAAPTPKEAIEAATDERMLQTYGELSQPGALERAADVAIHNEVRTKMYVTEANALAKATGKPKILAEAAKNFANEIISRKKIKDIRPLEYTHAETRAAKLADKAMRAGDLVVAAGEARNKVINGYAVKAAYAAQEEARSIQKKLAEFANRSDKKLGKSYDIDLVNAVRAVLGEYGIAPRMAKKGSEYLKAVERYDPEVFAIVRQSVAAAETNAKPIKEMTMEELRGLRDEIDSIIHLAKRMHQSEVDGKLLDIQGIETELMDRMTDIGVPGRIPGEGQSVTPGEEAMTKFKSLIAFARRVESWAGTMDGNVQMGPFKRYIWNRISDAAIKYRTDKAKYLKQYRDLIKTIAPTLKPQIIDAPELGYVFGKGSGGSAVNEIVHAILHTGNESNKRKLLLGRGWATELPDGTLNTSRWDRFVNRMVQEGKITKAHYDFAQGVWDMLDSTKELAQKTHRDVFGKYFDEVTSTSFQTPFGTYRGGYVPAQVDSRVVKDAAMRELADKDNAAMSYAFPTTPKGFTKARVEYNKPLTLDLRTLAQHIDKVLLFSHMEMPVRDVQRIMSKQVGETLNRINPAAIPAMLTPWLFRSARQQVETPTSGDAGTMKQLSIWRSRAGMAAMFGNLANTVQQVTGFALAAIKGKPKFLKLLMHSTADYLKDPKGFTAAVAAADPYMAIRMENEVAVMNGEISDILLNPTLLENGKAWTMRHAYFMQSAVDNVMSPIIWTAAYNQALAAGEVHADAVRIAAGTVRETQGSMQPEDISRIESGNAFWRWFTQFAGYFNMNANLLGSEYVKMVHDGGLRKNAGRGLYVYTMGLMIPIVVGELIIQAFRGGPDDEDKDGEYLDDWIAALGFAHLRYVTAMVPVGGQAVNALANAGNSKPYDDRIATSPAISMLESVARTPWSVYNAATGEASSQKAVKDVATLISMTLGLPANFAARPVGYLAGVADDKINPTGPVDFTRGLLTGSASPQSK